MTTPQKRDRLRGTCIDCGTPIPPRKHKKRCHECAVKAGHAYINTTPQQNMLITEWIEDEHGSYRTITGV